MIISQKQFEANHRNGKKGGVKTIQGKSVVRWNSLQHGLLAKVVVVCTKKYQEDRKDFDYFHTQLSQSLNPNGVLEEVLVEKIAVSYWKLRRLGKLESTFWGSFMGAAPSESDGAKTNALDTICTECLIKKLPPNPQAWEKEYTQKLDAETRYENSLILAAAKLLSDESLQKIVRYHSAIEREFYRAFHELERLQRMRAGGLVPPPLAVDIDIQKGNQ